MRTFRILSLAALLLPALAIAAPQDTPNSAQIQRMRQVLEQRFAAADTDHDGHLTLAEAQAGMPRVAQHFNDIDTNHVGYVTLPQIEAYIAAHAEH